MRDPEGEYPREAYAEEGALWWDVKFWPGTKRRFGAERKLAAWMTFNLDVGEVFTMRRLREALGTDIVPNDDEHLNRRLRRLRSDGWVFPTNKDDKSLGTGVYRLDQVGWNPALGARPREDTISKAMERKVFKRDGHRCVICGVGRGEPYPGIPGSRAVITVGHRVARAHGGSSKDSDNLETQCSPHNETVREEIPPESLDDVMLNLKRLNRAELVKLETWLSLGRRTRDRLDELHDRARSLTPTEREIVYNEARRRLGHGQVEPRN